jgi:hypothetical protein
MQPSPLLEKLDWAFTSSSWIISYPNTSAKALDMVPSDHNPLIISISTIIPKSKIFRFENFWLCSAEFISLVNELWSSQNHQTDPAKVITARFKELRKRLKEWQATKHGLRESIPNTKSVLQFLEIIGEFMDLSIEEWNFRDLVNAHLLQLLEQQRIYWKQR